MIAIERLDISPGDDDVVLRIRERFLYIDIYIQRIDESYAGLKDSSILEIFVGIAEKNSYWFHKWIIWINERIMNIADSIFLMIVIKKSLNG